MRAIVTPEHMRAIDAAATEPFDVLVERAGRAVARAARRLLGGTYGRRVVAIAGAGNNGADARVAARVLRAAGVHVRVVAPDVAAIEACDLVIDGAYGTGLSRAYVPPLIEPGTPVLAIDIPSGVDGRTGQEHGRALAAAETITFVAHKPGLLNEPGRSLAGEVTVAEIGLDIDAADGWLVDADDVATWVPQRPCDAHKWKNAVQVVGGSPGMHGAPSLAARAAMRSGSGYVRCAVPSVAAITAVDEVVYHQLPETSWAAPLVADPMLDRFGAVVVGPGLAPSAEVRELIRGIEVPVVIDGGALRSLDGITLRPHHVLTPHDGEYRAICGSPPDNDRMFAAQSLADELGATVLLKGPMTVAAAPGAVPLVVAHGDSRLATAGTGDVLAGVVGALLAQGVAPQLAAAAGAWVHADAAKTQPWHGTVASDLLDHLPHSISSLHL